MSDPSSTHGRTETDVAIPAPVSSAYANYVLGVLFMVYVFNFVDRQVLSVFIGPIKQEFGASDTEMGLLVGFAFAVLYTFAGIPIARWADRGNRRNIIALGLTVWSAMTAVCGFTKSFPQLFLARVGVGLGEAAGTPPAHSLISDYFPAHKRATALAIYASAVHVGASIAYLGGGYLREYFDWRTAFLVLGVPGMLFALVVRFTVREPARGYADQYRGSIEAATFMETLRFLLGSRTWVLLITGAAFIALTGYGVIMWGYEFFGRVHKMPPVETGKWLALIGVGGIVGSLVGGRIADSAFKHKPARMISVPALCTLACVPFGIVSMLTDTRWLVLTCFAIFSLLLNFYLPAVYSSIQSLAKLQMRATAVAILLFVINLIGAGVGPLLVGGLSDFFAPQFGADSIRYALLIIMLFGGIGCVFLIFSSRYFEQDLLRAKH
jgi:MFS family permease